MLTFSYEARNSQTGQKIKSTVEAESEAAAARLIREQGLSPLEIKLSSAGGGILKGRFNRVKARDRILYARQLATLINAGLPLLQSLQSVTAQTKSKPLKIISSRIISDIEGGTPLSAAMERHPSVFNPVFVNMIAAGEASGTLDKSLERLATQQEKDAEILSKVRGAMVYPLVVLFVMVLVVVFMLVKVLPQVEILYAGIKDARLPINTRILLALSHAITKYWWAFLIVFGLIVVFTSRWSRTITGKNLFDKIKMKAWPFGPLFMKLYMARFARTATTLVGSGVPLIRVLEITSKAINNVHIARSLEKAIDGVKGGKALSDTIKGDPNFLTLVPDMLKIGEQSGAIETMLAKTADYYEKEVDNQIKTISTIIEPAMMIMLGVVAMIIVSAVLLPVYGLAGKNLAG